MQFTRRSFLAGLGTVTVGLLFARKLDQVLESLERDFVAEPQSPDQLPAAATIVVVPVAAFRPKRLVVPPSIAPMFVIEDIRINGSSQIMGGTSIPAALFVPEAVDVELKLDTATRGAKICFRVRYVGSDPRGARFTGALVGRGVDSAGWRVLPIDSGSALVS